MSFTGAIKGGGLCHLFHFNHHNFLSHSFDIGDCPVLDSNHRTGEANYCLPVSVLTCTQTKWGGQNIPHGGGLADNQMLTESRGTVGYYCLVISDNKNRLVGYH